MKLTAIVLASAFALSSTYAVAATQHHKKHHGTYAQSAYAGNPNNRGGLVGGDDPGTSARYGRAPSQTGWNNNGWNNSYGWNNNYGGGGNNRGGLVGGDDPGTRRP